MTDMEILQKALEKTKKKYDILKIFDCNKIKIKECWYSLNRLPRILIYLCYKTHWQFIDYEKIIFSHDFAKAFFDDIYGMGGKTDFKCHLAKMVIEKEPLKYLEKFLDV